MGMIPEVNRRPGAAPARRGRWLTRRQALGGLIGAAGLAAIAGAWRGQDPGPTRASSRLAGLSHHVMHPGTPEATPPLGERLDGSRLWRVRVGGFSVDDRIDTQAFFPAEITINAGDAVYFDFGARGFHTVTFPGGDELPPLLVPEDGTPATAEPRQILNPAVAYPSGGDRVGAGYVNSGLDVLHEPGAIYSLTFPTPGTYDYVCLPHAAVMRGRVIVQAAGSALPMAQDGCDAVADEQFAALVEQGKAEAAASGEATATRRADGSTLWEATVGAGNGQARIMRFLPDKLEVRPGDSVRWVNRSPGEPHTVTFVGDESPPKDFLLEEQGDGPPKLVANPLVFAPAGGSVHAGNGYLNSGFLGEPLGPASYEVRFDTPGTFGYVCLPHLPMGMVGSITVGSGPT